jgi:hypothetical protein
MSAFDLDKVQYVSLVEVEGGKAVASYSPREYVVDPDLIAGFVTAVIIFARTPIRTIRKATYDLLIEVGDSYLVILVVDPVPDEAPYRNILRKVLHLFENFSLDWIEPPQIRELHSQLTRRDPEWFNYHLLQHLLSSLGLSWMGFLDGNPIEHLKYILPRMEYSSRRTEIYDYVRERICEQIDAGGTTIGIDIDSMIHDGHFAARISKVLEKRQSEIRDVEVVVEDNTFNLKNFWLTAYGFNMKQHGMRNVGHWCSLETFDKIQKNLNTLGIKLRVSPCQSQVNIPGLSKGMRDYIWAISRESSKVLSSLSSNLVKCIIKLLVE